MIFVIVVSLLLATLMELNRNTIPGFILLIVLDIAFGILKGRFINGHGRLISLAGYACLFAALALVFFISRPPVRLVPAYQGKTPEYTDTVTIDDGKLQGVYDKGGKVEIYAGIPYAKPPVGDLRWKRPVDPDKWSGVLKADHFAPMSMQPSKGNIYDSLARIIGYHDYTISTKDNYTPAMSEDSLYLNVWKPAGKCGKRPVIVYIHGGSLQTGQPWYEDYYGSTMAASGVVYVNMGYRLGVFGFHADSALADEDPDGSTGNYGLLDQIKALTWVQKNIAAFGGDPDNVTLAGESAGSACVSALCTSPLAKGLFKRAILESSTYSAPNPAHSFRLMDEALETGKKLYDITGTKSIEELRKLPAGKIVNFADEDHHVTVDGYALTTTVYESYMAGEHNEEELLMGFNKEESAPFALFTKIKADNVLDTLKAMMPEGKEAYAEKLLSCYDISTDEKADRAYKDILSALWFSYGHYCLARQARAHRETCYEYYFSEDNGRLGSWHSGEEVYCYGNIPKNSRLYDNDDRRLSSAMFTYWRNFAATGDPNRTESGESKVDDIYDIYGEDAEPDLPVFAPVSDVKRVTRFENSGDSFVREVQDPFLPVYGILDEMYGYGQ